MSVAKEVHGHMDILTGCAGACFRHTMTLRFPEVRSFIHVRGFLRDVCWPQEPTQDERDALNNYFHLMSRLYPCGECAAEFQLLLKKFPPQVSLLPTLQRVIIAHTCPKDIFTTSRCYLVSAAFLPCTPDDLQRRSSVGFALSITKSTNDSESPSSTVRILTRHTTVDAETSPLIPQKACPMTQWTSRSTPARTRRPGWVL